MIYLTQMLGKPVLDSTGEQIGAISDIGISTAEVFPRVTSLAFKGPDKTPFMLSWRKFVDEFDGDAIRLASPAAELRFSYLQPDELLLSRDLLNKQIVDTQGMRVVRVNDLKLSESRSSLRLLGAEVGMRGLLRALHPVVERATLGIARVFGTTIPENLIAWSYMDLVESDLSQVKLSVTHKRLNELHPADVADILEQLAPSQRATVFAHLDRERAADAISELEDEYQADIIDDLSERQASDLLAEMDPDDAADIMGELGYEKTERLLHLMGIDDANTIRGLLGYREKSAGGLMTPEVLTATEGMTVREVIHHIREVAEERETINYVYAVDENNRLVGVVSLRRLLLSASTVPVGEIIERELFTVNPEEDQEEVASLIARYDLLAVPVVDESGILLGIVTIDDALDVLEEEAEEDLARATGVANRRIGGGFSHWLLPRRSGWIVVWLAALLGTTALRTWVASANNTVVANLNTSQLYVLAQGSELAVIVAMILPMLLITLEGAVLRGFDELADIPADERTSVTRRYAFGLFVGAAAGLLTGMVAFSILEIASGGAALQLSAMTGGATAVVGALSGVFGTWLVNRTVSVADAGREPRTEVAIGAVMIMAAVLIVAVGFIAAWAAISMEAGSPVALW